MSLELKVDKKIYVNEEILKVSKDEILKAAEDRPKPVNYVLDVNQLTFFNLLTYEQCTQRVIIYIKHALYNEFTRGEEFLIQLKYGRTQFVDDSKKANYGNLDIETITDTLKNEGWKIKQYNNYYSPETSWVLKIEE